MKNPSAKMIDPGQFPRNHHLFGNRFQYGQRRVSWRRTSKYAPHYSGRNQNQAAERNRGRM